MVYHLEKRLIEAQKLGFKQCIVPAENAKNLKIAELEIIGVKNVSEALEEMYERRSNQGK